MSSQLAMSDEDLRPTAAAVPSVRDAPIPAYDPIASFSSRIEQLDAVAPMTDRTRANVIRALASIHPEERRRFIAKYKERLENLHTYGPAKYADFACWAYRRVRVAEWLELDRTPPMDILDIGMGPGSFAMVAQSMGHRVLGTDVADEWYGELCGLAGVERLIAPVERGERYRPTDRRFDLITIMLPVFHRKRVRGRREYWAVEEWQQLLAGLQRDLLKTGGGIFILMPLDIDDEGNQTYSPLLEWARSRGATLDRAVPNYPISYILFRPVGGDTFAPTQETITD